MNAHDAEYFQGHPHRNFRLRRICAGEFAPRHLTHVVVMHDVSPAPFDKRFITDNHGGEYFDSLIAAGFDSDTECQLIIGLDRCLETPGERLKSLQIDGANDAVPGAFLQ